LTKKGSQKEEKGARLVNRISDDKTPPRVRPRPRIFHENVRSSKQNASQVALTVANVNGHFERPKTCSKRAPRIITEVKSGKSKKVKGKSFTRSSVLYFGG
jgi:hypothetical protein